MKNISISKNRVAVELENGKTAQFVVYDLEKSQHEDLKNQIDVAFNLSSDFDDIVKHLKINGFDAELEEIY